MPPLADLPGGALVDLDGATLTVALWGVPGAEDYDVVARGAEQAPRPRLVRLDLSGLAGDPGEAAGLADRLEDAGCRVEVVVAPGGRVARRLAGRAPRLRLVDDVA